jgi:hypothetical protein
MRLSPKFITRSRTTPTNPHTQLEQNPQPEMVEELARRGFILPGVEAVQSEPHSDDSGESEVS